MTGNPTSQTTAARANGRNQRSRRGRPGLFLIICTVLYGLLLLTVSVTNMIGPERWWFGSLNLYLPQWPWALPCVVLLPWYLTSAWRWAWIPLVMLAWVFGPIAGFCFNWPTGVVPQSGTKLRVMTYNVKWGNRDPAAVLANIAAAHPDVILMQDSAGTVDGPLKALREQGWNILLLDQYSVLSHYKLTQPEARWLTAEHTRGCLRCVLQVNDQNIALYDVHLVTPRWALGAVQESGQDAALTLQENVSIRELEATTLAIHILSEHGPVILTGDLNAPVQSQACRTLFGVGLRDAFSQGGWGYGFTYGQSTPLERPFMRIDHILVSSQWTILDCREGSPKGSDHSPVIADLVLPDAR